MKKIRFISIPVFMILATIFSSAMAQTIAPIGQVIGKDKEGVAVYQIDANGIKIGYKLFGSGEPLLLIMGMGSTMDAWPKEVINTLAKKYQLILMDNRGMGHTTVNEKPFTYKIFADDAVALLDALKVEKTNVLGFSMGSTITQQLLLQYAQRFNKAVIYATSIDGSGVAAMLKNKAPKFKAISNPIVLRQLKATAKWKTPLDKMSLIPNQVMLLVGTADRVVGVESSQALASTIPGAWLVQFKNGSHLLMHEEPNEFTKIIMAFFDMDSTVKLKQ